MTKRLLLLPAIVCALAMAQDPPSLAGRLSYISGNVSFQPGGVNDWAQASRNRPLTVGDQVFADQGARAEVEIPQAEFRLGSRTAFEFLNLDDRNAQVKLSEGTLAVRVRAMDQNIEVDTPNAAFTISAPGDYRIDADPDNNQTSVTARNGEGQVTANGGSFALHERQQAVIAGQDQSAQYQVYAAPAYDEFDNWAMSRERRFDQRVSSRHVSPYAVGYEDLDDYGTWRSNPQYGDMWVPRGVRSGWAPYQDGHWAWVEPWGWTWVDDQPWGYAPFHYGRWAYVDNSWGWVPCPARSRPFYAPALVAWVGLGGGGGLLSSFGLGSGSVGWFPLGPRDVYLPSYRSSPTYVSQINTTNTTYINNTYVNNTYNNYMRTGNVPITSYANRTVPGAVVAVPQAALVNARPVQQVITRVQPAQLNAVHSVAAAPRVAPQVASVLGRPTSLLSSAPHPPAAVVSRPVVARLTPPPAPAPFQKRQTLLAKDPGRPIPIQQQHQIAAVRPPVHVMAQARPVTPAVVNHPAPPPGKAAAVAQPPAVPGPQPGVHAPAPAVAQRPQAAPQARPFEPPSAQHPGQPGVHAQVAPPPVAHPAAPQPAARAQAPAPVQAHPAPAPQPAARAQAPRPFEPPSPRPQAQAPVRAQAPPPQAHAAPAQAPRQAPPPVRAQAAPPVQRQAPPPARAYQPPPQQHPQPAVRAQAPSPRPAPAPQARQNQQGEASRVAPPPARAQAPPPRPAPAPARAVAPPPQAHAQPQPAPHKPADNRDEHQR